MQRRVATAEALVPQAAEVSAAAPRSAREEVNITRDIAARKFGDTYDYQGKS